MVLQSLCQVVSIAINGLFSARFGIFLQGGLRSSDASAGRYCASNCEMICPVIASGVS